MPVLPTPTAMLSAIFTTTFTVGERCAKSSNPMKIAAAPKPHSISTFGHISCLIVLSSILLVSFDEGLLVFTTGHSIEEGSRKEGVQKDTICRCAESNDSQGRNIYCWPAQRR